MRTRRIIAAATAAIAAVGLSAVPAAAQVVTLDVTAQCADPLAGPVRVAVTTDVETPAYLSPVAEARRITGTVTLPAATVDGLIAKGATSVSGYLNLSLAISGANTAEAVNTLALASLPLTAGRDLVFPAVGYTSPAYTSKLVGTNNVDLTGLWANLYPRRADTSPVVRGGIHPKCTLPEPKRWLSIRTESVIAEYHPAPKNLKFSNITTDSITVSWDPTSGLLGPPLGYDILVDEVPALRLIGAGNTTGTLTGLKPDTDHYIRIRAVERGYERRSEVFPIRTRSFFTHNYFDTGGSVTIKGTHVQLLGEQVTKRELATGNHTSNPTFAPTQVRLGGLGTAHLEFTPLDPATGTFQGGVFTETIRQKVTIARVTLGGRTVATPNCSTTVELPLTSGPDFRFNGTPNLMSGTFTIPPLRDCGPATTLINRLVAGPGNTAAINFITYAG
ncbi:fibronectin type III domain-containing protein [Actinokineospora globicatena]|uniref:fibronectin type III domain-containing protein n=1 Tax=Actinokineospora globicatena TaxID=103729 RepID=UPI0020A4FAAA|nr:fibronectin type III domain-containing protein [Actinokineospora globicatena]MCP2302986.1 Fibronectin type III domain-containing protein [Actinokineospora globicatena]GLW79907.1 hypothetical protein Aglo01_43880 [Actinokineospora globicatena]GLW85683.1 hypothetical protein Aglo02_33230 [Actinokineospora globicatena]